MSEFIVIRLRADDGPVQWVLADHVVPGLIFARHVMGLAFIVTAASYLTLAVWRQTAVGVETMLVAVGLYFLIGVFWETVFELTEFLQVPVAPVMYVISVFAGLATLVLVANTVRHILHRETKPSGGGVV